jgi:hypothetical protein
MLCLLIRKEDEMDRARSMYREEKNTYRVMWDSQKERDHSGELDMGGRIIL